MPKLDEELLSFLKSNGTSLAAFADLSKIDSAAREGFPIGISIAIALDPRIMSGIKAGPTAAYVGECQRADNLLDVLGQATARFLEQKGHKAKPRTKPGAENPDILSTKLPQKTVATRAGLGWVGKCTLLITKKYGSAIRLATVLTDAPLAAGQSINESLCAHCTRCVDACPAGAITGEEWCVGTERASLVDVFSCRQSARALLEKRTGGEIIGRTFCGLCIVACPWTQDYLKRAL